MYTPAHVSHSIGISPTSVRAWGRELSDVLSPAANPPAGEDRRYTDDDLAIFATAKVMRAEKQSWGDIVEAIRAGHRIEPVIEATPDDQTGAGALVTAEWWDRVTQPYRDQVAELKDELATERAAHLDAEKRATAAETEARMLREQQEGETETGDKKSLLDRIFGRS